MPRVGGLDEEEGETHFARGIWGSIFHPLSFNLNSLNLFILKVLSKAERGEKNIDKEASLLVVSGSRQGEEIGNRGQ